jgi:hypothetical protein
LKNPCKYYIYRVFYFIVKTFGKTNGKTASKQINMKDYRISNAVKMGSTTILLMIFSMLIIKICKCMLKDLEGMGF